MLQRLKSYQVNLVALSGAATCSASEVDASRTDRTCSEGADSRGILEAPESADSHEHEHGCRAGQGAHAKVAHRQAIHKVVRLQDCMPTKVSQRGLLQFVSLHFILTFCRTSSLWKFQNTTGAAAAAAVASAPRQHNSCRRQQQDSIVQI